MVNDKWSQVKEILDAAIRRPADERPAFLDEACDGDQSIRHEVDSLLSSFGRADGFMNVPAADIAAENQAIMRHALAAGDVIGHYKIIRKIGEGGMGEVYLAYDSGLDRKAAIKVLSSDRGAGFLERFILEARAASALNHPNICTIYEINREYDPPFIAMEYIEGESLDQHLRRGPLKTSTVVDIALHVAEALADAHEAGIIHRDIKPANIIVTKRGRIKIVDFGLAKKLMSDPEAATQQQLSHSGMIIGTVSYMSPEQARGQTVDARTDVWSLGVVLYEMLAGRRPFAGETTGDIIASILRSEPAFSFDDRELPSDLVEILRVALSKEKDARYVSARRLADSLRTAALNCVETNDHHDETTAVLDERLVGSRDADTEILRNEATRKEVASRSTLSSRRRLLAAIAASVLLVAAAAVGLLYFKNPFTGRASIDSLAVMPLVNQTGNPDSEYLSDGITESLIGRLSQIPNLSVKARSSVFRFKGKDVSPKDIGSALNVPAILTGRIARHNDQLSLYIELVDAATEKVIWQRTYDRPEASLATIPGEIARDIAGNLRQKLSGAEEEKIIRNYTENAAAYELYLKGRYYWDKRNEESYRVAEDAYKQAIALDPNYALAYAGLADCYLFRDPLLTRKIAMPKAKELALKALELDDSLAEAHTTLAFVTTNYELNMVDGEREFKRAIELKPNYAIAHQFYSSLLLANGRIDEGLSEMRKAVELEPYTVTINWSLGMGLSFARRYDESIAQLQKTLQIQPNHGLTENTLAGTYILVGRYDDAMALVRKYLENPERRDSSLSNLAMIYIKTGRVSEARKVIKEMIDKCKQECGNTPNGIARAYAVLGDKDEAIHWLNIGYDRRVFNVFFTRVDPFFDSLQGDPRFDELVRRIGLSS